MFFKLKMKPASAKDETSTNYIKSSRPFKIEKGLNSINSAKKNYVKTDIAMYHPKKKLFFSVPKNQSNNYELQQNNKCLFDRINNIYKRGDRRMEQLMKPGFEKNKKHNSGYKKLEILYLAQDNLTMLKRLTEKKSTYSVNKMEKDYKKMQNYKKCMCQFPTINFCKSKETGPIIDSYNYHEAMNKANINKYNKPTEIYLNDGYLDKLGKEIMDKKKKKESPNKKSEKKDDKKSEISKNEGSNKKEEADKNKDNVKRKEDSEKNNENI